MTPPALIAAATLAAWLLARPVGSVAALAGADAAAVRSALAAADTQADRRLGVVFAWRDADGGETLADCAANALAAAARAAFPYWFGSDLLAGIGRTHLDSVLLDHRLRAVQGTVADLSPFWARHAFLRAIDGRLPRVGELPLAVELRQLALTLSGGPLTLIPALSQAPAGPAALAAQRGAEWLARQSAAAVVLLVPSPAPCAALDRVAWAQLAAAPPTEPTAEDPSAGPWAGPIEGRPHWASTAEQTLARALAADAALAPLFGFNQTVPTRRGGRPRVDLLWRAGRLVVEIDGYADHATRAAFRRDRQRDYELAVSGYLVLRLTADEVLADPALALDKLRDAVKFRHDNKIPETE